MKKICFIFLLIVFCSFLTGDIGFINISQFNISIPESSDLDTFDKSTLIKGLEEFISSNKNITGPVDIKLVTHTQGKPVSKKFVIYTVNDIMGDAELIRGPNDKYKIKSARNDTSYIRYRFLNSYRYDDWMKLNTSCVVVLGKNVDMKIDRIEMSLGTGPINGSKVSLNEYFIRYMPAQDYSQNKFPVGIYVKAYNESNIDITDDVYR